MKIDGCDYFDVPPQGCEGDRATCGPAQARPSCTRPSPARTRTPRRTTRRSTAAPRSSPTRPPHDPLVAFEHELIARGAAQPGAGRRDPRRRARARPRAADAALAAPQPDPASALDHLVALPAIIDRCPASRRSSADAPPVTFGEAIRLTLHEPMANDERIRVFGEDVADADGRARRGAGIGGVFGTTYGLHASFGAARCYNTPLAEANIVGRGVGQALRGLRPCPRSSSSTTSGRRCSRSARRRRRRGGARTARSRARWCCGCAIGGYLPAARSGTPSAASRSSPTSPGCDLMFPSRARDAAGHAPRRVPLRGPGALPRAQAPLPAALPAIRCRRADYMRAVRQGGVRPRRRRPHDRHLGRHGAPLAARGRTARRRGDRVEILDLRTLAPVGPRDRRRLGDARPAACSSCTRTCSRADSAPRSPHSSPTSASSTSTPRCGGCAAADTWVAYEPGLEDAILPQVADIKRDLEALLKY